VATVVVPSALTTPRKFPVAGGVPNNPPQPNSIPAHITPPVMVPIAVFWIESKSAKSTAPGIVRIVTPR
jgi:hypothetical protein